MKELNYRFKSIEEKMINGKEVHKVKDIFNDNEAFVEKFKEIKDMDWEGTSKIEDELNKLKDNKTIIDFFYNNDYDRDVKIFYKVFEHYGEYETQNTPIPPKPQKEPPLEQKEALTEEKASTVHKLNGLGGSVKLDIEQKKEEKKELLNKNEDEIKKQIENTEDIFSSKLISNIKNIATKDKSQGLELHYKKTVSRAEMNNEIICKVCEQPLKKERLDIEKNIGYCENCHAIRQIKKLNQEEKARKNISIIAPDGITVKNTNSKLHIETQLNIKSGFASLVVAFLVLIFEFAFYSTDIPAIFIFALFAVAIIYNGLINIINKVHIDVTKQNIIIKSKPLPHFPMKTFASNIISQIYVKEYIHRNKNNITYSYKVRAILKNGTDKVIVKLDNSDYALYLERSIESWLRIEDRHVSGEYK